MRRVHEDQSAYLRQIRLSVEFDIHPTQRVPHQNIGWFDTSNTQQAVQIIHCIGAGARSIRRVADPKPRAIIGARASLLRDGRLNESPDSRSISEPGVEYNRR